MKKLKKVFVFLSLLFIVLSSCKPVEKKAKKLNSEEKKVVMELSEEISLKIHRLSELLGDQYKIKTKGGLIVFDTQGQVNAEEDEVEIIWVQSDGGCEDEVNQMSCEGKCPCK